MIIVVFVLVMIVCYYTIRRNDTIAYRKFDNVTSNGDKNPRMNCLQMGILKLFHTEYYTLENPILDIDE